MVDDMDHSLVLTIVVEFERIFCFERILGHHEQPREFLSSTIVFGVLRTEVLW